MASSEYWPNHGESHVVVSTIHTDLLGAFVEWGAEVYREKKHRVPSAWWNPFSWARYEWRREGHTGFSDVAFFRGDGSRIPETVLQPQLVQNPGYIKFSAIYTYVSVGTGDSSAPADLGNDARSVTNVKVTYVIDGETHTLSDH
jgi:hypothetical protein